jgi:two-component system, NtrC family, response regulator AlgB
MKILVVDDQESVRKSTSYALRTMGHEPFVAQNFRDSWQVLDEEPIDAMFLDINLGPEAGLDLLTQMKARGLPTAVIVFTAQSSIDSAVEAMRRGAYDYISKPFIPDDIKQKLLRLEHDRRERVRIRDLEVQVADSQPRVMLDSAEPSVVRAYDLAFRAADSEATILILGSSGTGKSVLARAVHARSRRAAEPFVTINCPSLSRELLESELFGHTRGSFTGAVKDTWGKVAAAEGGTLFLDEIGELPLEIQPKLLRLLQDLEYERLGETRTRRANVRVIAATNRELGREVTEGRFREDLYYRLKVITVTMPSLVDRPGDLRPLVDSYLAFFAQANGKRDCRVSPEAMEAIAKYGWPGNLRELRNVIERGVILAAGNLLTPNEFPDELRDATESAVRPGHFVTLDELEDEHIRRVVEKTDSFEQAANILGIDTATLYRKRKRLDAGLKELATATGS